MLWSFVTANAPHRCDCLRSGLASGAPPLLADWMMENHIYPKYASQVGGEKENGQEDGEEKDSEEAEEEGEEKGEEEAEGKEEEKEGEVLETARAGSIALPCAQLTTWKASSR